MKISILRGILVPYRSLCAFTGLMFTLIAACPAADATTPLPPHARVVASATSVITSFAPANGQAGTLIKLTGTNLTGATELIIGGKSAVIVSNSGTGIIGMVMPKNISGSVKVRLANGEVVIAKGIFTITATLYPTMPQSGKLVDTASAQPYAEYAILSNIQQGKSVAVNADGNTAIVGTAQAISSRPAGVIFYKRTNGVWAQDGPFREAEHANVTSVALSADGNTAISGSQFTGGSTVTVYTRSNGFWGPGMALAFRGVNVGISADGNTAIVGGTRSVAHIYTRNGTNWVPDNGLPFIYNDDESGPFGGDNSTPAHVAISADAKVAVVATPGGGTRGSYTPGQTYIYTRATATATEWMFKQKIGEAQAVSLSGDGNTLLVNNTDVYTRTGSKWAFSQKVNGEGSAAMSVDGKTIIYAQNGPVVYTLTGTTYTIQPIAGPKYPGLSVALSADGTTAFIGDPNQNTTRPVDITAAENWLGAVYAFGTYSTYTPEIAASAIAFANTTSTTTSVSWANGSGRGRAVFIKDTTDGKPFPANIIYTSNVRYHSGYQIGNTGWYCIYNGTGSAVNVIGLVADKTYRVAVMEYKGTIDKPQYFLADVAPANVAPQTAPPLTQASNLVFSNRRATSGTVSWANGSGAKRAVFLKRIPYPYYYAEEPSQAEVLAAGTNVAPFADNGSWECVYNGTGSTVNLTGLWSLYYTAAVLEYNGDSDNPKFLFPAAVKLIGTATEYKAPTDLRSPEITATTATAEWGGAGSGGSVDQYGSAVFIKLTDDGTNTDRPLPANINYQASTRFGVGSQIGNSGWYCVYNGPSTYYQDLSVKITGLTTGRIYQVAVVGYIGTINAPQYLPGTASKVLLTALVEPTGYATGLAFSNTAATSTTLSWVNSNGSGRAVFLKLGTSGALNVQQRNTYAANSIFGLGDMAGTNGWYCVYNGTGSSINITGLNPANAYRAIVLEYNSYLSAGGPYNEMYNLTRYNGANVTTTAAAMLALTTNQKRMVVEHDAQADNATELNIHQGMSPNGDGSNDVFTIDGIGSYPQNTVKIMNSNGDLIYTASGYDNYLKAFDGHSATGTHQKAGTYFYSLEYKKGAVLVRKTGYLVIKY